MSEETMTDGAAAARHARFGKLPERIRYEDMVEDQVTSPDAGAAHRYDPEGAWNHFNCLAYDLGL
ncbi:hypothetical protein [Streptomyces sp. NPDC058382]|uniref:hypothetical protein n=1 Tax=unclassified Streptomyces TaxID=2593676 RepID=UPI00362B534B